MKRTLPITALCGAILLAVAFPVAAEKGGRHGNDDDWPPRNEHRAERDRPNDRGDRRIDRERPEARQEYRVERRQERHYDERVRFVDRDRSVVLQYFGDHYVNDCPPGLAKKHNGCLPPGQAKKWSRGRALPRDVRYYDLPPDLLVLMPPPPPGHRYVRVAGDILLITVGTSMVVDAIQDIMR